MKAEKVEMERANTTCHTYMVTVYFKELNMEEAYLRASQWQKNGGDVEVDGEIVDFLLDHGIGGKKIPCTVAAHTPREAAEKALSAFGAESVKSITIDDCLDVTEAMFLEFAEKLEAGEDVSNFSFGPPAAADDTTPGAWDFSYVVREGRLVRVQ